MSIGLSHTSSRGGSLITLGLASFLLHTSLQHSLVSLHPLLSAEQSDLWFLWPNPELLVLSLPANGIRDGKPGRGPMLKVWITLRDIIQFQERRRGQRLCSQGLIIVEDSLVNLPDQNATKAVTPIARARAIEVVETKTNVTTVLEIVVSGKWAPQPTHVHVQKWG